VRELAGAGRLSPEQLEVCEKAQRLVTLDHPTFDSYWRAWEVYAVIAGHELPDDVRSALRSAR